MQAEAEAYHACRSLGKLCTVTYLYTALCSLCVSPRSLLFSKEVERGHLVYRAEVCLTRQEQLLTHPADTALCLLTSTCSGHDALPSHYLGPRHCPQDFTILGGGSHSA